MHDGISFEQSGKRALVLCTEPFAVTGHNIARVMGLADYPFALLAHPLGSLSAEQIEQRAADAVQQCLAILTE
ncbi:MAG: hypothetical protein AAF529_08300 [Pseudomonadota bacterium]